MSLIGNTTEEQIWNYLMSKINNPYGVAGLMGNMFAESGLKSTNLQNTYEKKLGMTDETYTMSVDNGDYTNFVYDKAGYGLVQWTYWSLKKYLLDFARARNKSIGDLEMQLECVCTQFKTQYTKVWSALLSATSVKGASNAVLLQFERPADQSVAVQNKRAEYGQKYYDKFAQSIKEETSMSNSPLVDCIVKSPNHSGARTHSIDRITPHCVVGQLTAESIGGCFTSSSRQASCNYGIGTEGRVVLCVDEANRSWCSSSNANDQRAVTIECASDMSEPYAMNSKVYNKLVDLCVDICKRNGKKKLIWFGNKEKTLNYSPASDEMIITVHRWFANKSCPGDWLYNRLGDLAKTVTQTLGGASATPSTPSTGSNTSFPATPFSVQVLVSDLNIRKEPKMGNNVVGQTGKGVFTITAVTDGWGKLKSGAGYIYLENSKYVTIKGSVASAPATKADSSFKVKVTASALNVRKGVGTGYGISTVVHKNEVYTIVETQGNWGKLKSGAGWICLDYTKRV